MWSAEAVVYMIKKFRNYLDENQCTFEEITESQTQLDQSRMVGERISDLLDIYSQILKGREFNEDYLKKYLGE